MSNQLDKNFNDGIERLSRFRDDARRKALSEMRRPDVRATSFLGQNLLERITEDNLASLVVYQDTSGKWQSDLILKDLPVGVPNVLGTSAEHSLGSFEEAEEFGYDLLVMAMTAILERSNASRDRPIQDERLFLLDGIAFNIPGETVDFAATLIADMSKNNVGIEAIESLLTRCRREIVGSDEALTKEVFDGASEQQRLLLVTACSMMLSLGIYSYPMRLDAATRVN